MSRPRYRCLPHTADIRLRVWGREEQELLTNAVVGCVSCALGRRVGGRGSAERRVDSWPADLESQLVKAANEALFLLYTQQLVVVAVAVAGGAATLEVRPLAVSEKPQIEIKAATFHDLHVAHCRRGLSVDLVLDT